MDHPIIKKIKNKLFLKMTLRLKKVLQDLNYFVK